MSSKKKRLSREPPEALPAEARPAQPVGADQVSPLAVERWVAAIVVSALVVCILVVYGDYWVWYHVSPTAMFEAITGESNVGIALAALYAIYSSRNDSQATRELIYQWERREMEFHDLHEKVHEEDSDTDG